MAQFDVFENPAGAGYLLDIQSDLTQGLNTRIVVPLLRPDDAPLPAKRLNPNFDLAGERVVMVTQFMAAAPASELRRPIGSLDQEHDAIVAALDMIFFGF
jgi:toxin CcdB